MSIIIPVTKQLIAQNITFSVTFWSRFLGLMLKKTLPKGEALVIKPCNSIHTFFMRFPIDVVFTDEKWRVVAVYENLRPWRVTKIVKEAKQVIELPAGTLKGKLKVGAKLEVS